MFKPLLTGILLASAPALAQELASLELHAVKTDIEHLPIKTDRPFAPATLNYSVTVEASYTDFLLVNARPSSGASLSINGNAATPGQDTKVPLALGENRITVTAGGSKTYQINVTRKDLAKIYTSEPIGKGMWRIKDFGGYIGNQDMYLIEGQNRAVLFDTGMGRGSLGEYVATLTKLPVDVAITHGNRDHFLQVDQFPNSIVYMSELDVTRLPPQLVTPRFHWVKGGDVIDLGGRRFEVVNVPGHSLGSVLYIDFANKIAITGDAISSGSMVYMFAPTCGALDEYLDGLRKLEQRLKPLDAITLLVGHHYQERVPLNGKAGKQLITDMRIAAEKVLRGEAEGKLTTNTRDGRSVELRQLNEGLAGLWYNPKNLRTDPAALEFLDIRTTSGQYVIPRPVFSSFQRDYAAVVDPSATAVEITPTAYWPNHKSISINGRRARSGAPFAAVLNNGENKFEIAVTPAEGAARTYTVTLTK